MKKIIIFLVIVCSSLSLYSFHIVGGEIEFLYLGKGRYRINLIQYFDIEQHENPGPEPSITVSMFSSSDNSFVSEFILLLDSETRLQYTNPECAIAELATAKVIWTNEFDLNVPDFQDPNGYYFAWERCCRNAAIRNIVNPSGTGMKYVLKIPPLMVNGDTLVNSSPSLFEPLRDYACVNQLYYTSFTGTDPDGDSLVYSLNHPFNSSSREAVPIPQPAPHIPVSFRNGFSVDNMISGNPPLRIDKKGRLTISPTETGLFVFSIKVEEFRKGVKIGEVFRDFQMLVIDGCNPPDPPEVDLEIPSDPDFDNETDTLSFVLGENTCFNFIVTNVTPGETVSFRAEGVNFDATLNDVFQINSIEVEDDNAKLIVEICMPKCPPLQNEPFILDLIAADDACPLPQLGIARLIVNLESPANQLPTINPSSNKSISVNEDDVYSEVIQGLDADNDSLMLDIFVEGLGNISSYGFSLVNQISERGKIESLFTWDTDCLANDFSEKQNFRVGFRLEDIDTCEVTMPVMVYYDMEVILPPNTFPEIEADIPDTIVLGTTVSFNVTATDADGDEVTLDFVDSDFEKALHNISFERALGDATVSSTFKWDVACNSNLYADGQEGVLMFVSEDNDKCKVTNFDTLKHNFTLVFPDNDTPQFEETEENFTYKVGQDISILIEASDRDTDDLLTLSIIRQPDDVSVAFNEVTGKGRVSSFLEWNPSCIEYEVNAENKYEFKFVVYDDACVGSASDTLEISVEIIDEADTHADFEPPNVFTPNGDGKNDSFRLYDNDNPNQNLPLDICNNVFEYIIITNRAGVRVLKSTERRFEWFGEDYPAGIYYYYIKYSRAEYKGFIHLIF